MLAARNAHSSRQQQGLRELLQRGGPAARQIESSPSSPWVDTRGQPVKGRRSKSHPALSALAPSLSSSTHSPEADRPFHKKSENSRAPGHKQAGEVGTRSPARSSSEVVGLRLPAWETGE
jgi:hypothetical protein